MGGINFARVVLGGLVAGLVLNVGEFVLNEPILGQQWTVAMAGLGLPPFTGAQIGRFVVLTFIVGVVLVWLYAAIRPRFGAGVQTAVIAGLAVWLLVWVLAGLFSVAAGVYPMNLTLIAIVWGVVEVPLAAIAGAWLYKE